MRKNIIFCAVAAMFLFGFIVDADQGNPSIHFEQTRHNFGKVNEEEGELDHDFVFTNKGQEPLIVTNVKTGNGVSVTGWTRNPVLPGESGTISVAYDPVNKPGRFNRSITINATGSPSSLILRLLGEVIPREKTIEELYPREIGPLRIRSNHISFGRVTPGSLRTDSLQIINTSDLTLNLSFSGIPSHIALEAVPESLSPGEKGLLLAEYDADQINDWGVITHNFRILVNEVSHVRNMIYLSANIQEDFSVLSDEEIADAPVIFFENKVFDFDKISSGESIEHDFIFSNNGNSELIIRAVRAGCGCTAIEPQKTLLEPGESSSIKAVFNSRGFRGMQNKGITVISNDPANSTIVLRITGEVVSE